MNRSQYMKDFRRNPTPKQIAHAREVGRWINASGLDLDDCPWPPKHPLREHCVAGFNGLRPQAKAWRNRPTVLRSA